MIISIQDFLFLFESSTMDVSTMVCDFGAFFMKMTGRPMTLVMDSDTIRFVFRNSTCLENKFNSRKNTIDNWFLVQLVIVISGSMHDYAKNGRRLFILSHPSSRLLGFG